MRSNEYKSLIYQVLAGHHMMTLKDIHVQIPDADFSSIYRNVAGLNKDGTVKKIIIDKNKVCYELASHDHGHFVCNDCHEVEAVEVPRSITGNRIVHDVLLRGQCDTCAG